MIKWNFYVGGAEGSTLILVDNFEEKIGKKTLLAELLIKISEFEILFNIFWYLFKFFSCPFIEVSHCDVFSSFK